MFKRLLFVWTATLFLSVSAFAQQRGFYFVANTAPPDDFLSLRTLPSSVAGQRIATLPNGTLLQVLQRQSDGWWYVRVVSTGQQGWALSGQGNKTWIDCCRTANTAQASNSEQGANDNAQDAPITDCDTYAASDQDPQRKALAVPTSNINSVLAIPECEAAVREHPNSSRLVYQLGRAYYKANNFGAAVAQFRRAAEQGYAPAQTNLGAMYAFGQGIPKDDAQAVAWFRKAADQGNAGAQADLGQMYRDGRGVPQDERQAVVWYGKAAEQGYAPAQNSLGDMYERGRGVPQDYRQAAAWYRKAADQGSAGAQANLARLSKLTQSRPYQPPNTQPSAPPPPNEPVTSPQSISEWNNDLVAKLARNKQYPAEALTNKEEGTVQVAFTVDRNGNLLDSRIIQTSGSNA